MAARATAKTARHVMVRAGVLTRRREPAVNGLDPFMYKSHTYTAFLFFSFRWCSTAIFLVENHGSQAPMTLRRLADEANRIESDGCVSDEEHLHPISFPVSVADPPFLSSLGVNLTRV